MHTTATTRGYVGAVFFLARRKSERARQRERKGGGGSKRAREKRESVGLTIITTVWETVVVHANAQLISRALCDGKFFSL